MTLDVSWLNEGMPIFGFVLVLVLIYAILAKTKILGESKPINVVISLILGIIFISFASVRTFVTNITPWFVTIITISFFFFMIVAFLIQEKWEAFTKPLTLIFMISFGVIIIIALFYTFPSTHAYLPGQDEAGADGFLLSVKHFILGEKFLSGLLLLIIAIIVGFIIAS